MAPTGTHEYVSCHTCGLMHRRPALGRGERAVCVRCGETVARSSHPRMSERVVAVVTAALVLYPVALLTPMLTVRQLGHEHSSNIWDGAIGLIREGQAAVGVVVLLGSVVAPVGKLLALLALCAGESVLHRDGHRPAYRLVEFLGRWGMIDVMLLAVLVAAAKLGDLVQITPGPGVVAFTAVVVLNIIASAMFDPAAIWEAHPWSPRDRSSAARVGRTPEPAA